MEVKCGVPVSKRRMPVNPVRDVFKRALTAYKETEKGHPAWDEVTVLAAVRGWERYFGTVRGRFDIVDAKGKNAWTPDPNGNHYVLTVKTPKAEVGAIVDELMARGSLPSVRNASALTEARTYASTNGATLGYRFHAPANLEKGRRYPLVLFLHGAGERGDDNVLQQVHGVWPILSYMKEKKIDGYLIAPQCPKGKRWVETPWDASSHKMPKGPSESMKLVLELLDKTLKECPVDERRVYVTGLSMGGYGTWDDGRIRNMGHRAEIPQPLRGGDAAVRRRRPGAGARHARRAHLGLPRRLRQGRAGQAFASDGLGTLGMRRQRALPRVSGRGTQLLGRRLLRCRRARLVLLPAQEVVTARLDMTGGRNGIMTACV